MQELPNTDVRFCDHPSHGDNKARAVTSIRFAVKGEVLDYWGCLEHRHATDFGYVPPNPDADREALASGAETEKPEEAVDNGVEFQSNADDDDAVDAEPEPERVPTTDGLPPRNTELP